MKYFLILVFCFLFSSCALIVNSNYSTTEIEVLPENTKIIVDGKDTLCCGNSVIHLRRSNYDVLLEFVSDSTKKSVYLESEMSDAFVWGNLMLYPGYIIDLFSKKKYAYPDYVYFDVNDSTEEFNLWDQRRKDQFNLVLSTSPFNQFIFKYGESQVNNYGIGGYSIGVELFIDSTDYLSAQTGFTSTSSFGNYSLKSYFTNVRYNWKNEAWHFGFGVSYHLLEQEKYIEQRLDNSNINYYYEYFEIKKKEGWGMALSAQYHLTKRFYVGMLYQNLLYNMDNTMFEDDHIISFELIWKINLFSTDFSQKA